MKLLFNRDTGFLNYELHMLEYRNNIYELSDIPIHITENIRLYEELNNCLFCYLYDEISDKGKEKYLSLVKDIPIFKKENLIEKTKLKVICYFKKKNKKKD